jgi:GTP pyrophosphokinase/guanosine-3',5'-bis(diphosphate) 3'-pyrophosphohydrolase
MDVEWADDTDRSFETSLWVLVKNGKGVLAQVASAVSAAEADITHLDMDPGGGGATADSPPQESSELRLLISVRDRQHLADVLRTMRRSPVVQRVARYRFH